MLSDNSSPTTPSNTKLKCSDAETRVTPPSSKKSTTVSITVDDGDSENIINDQHIIVKQDYCTFFEEEDFPLPSYYTASKVEPSTLQTSDATMNGFFFFFSPSQELTCQFVGMAIVNILTRSMDEKIQFLKQNEDAIIQDLVEMDPMHTRSEIIKDKSQDKLYESIFADPELTEEDKKIMKQRMEQNRIAFRTCRKRDRRHKLIRIRSVHPHVTNEECIYALNSCNGNEEDVITKLTDPSFLHSIRKRITMAESSSHPSSSAPDNHNNNNSSNNNNNTSTNHINVAPNSTPSTFTPSSNTTTASSSSTTTSNTTTEEDDEEMGENEDSEDEDFRVNGTKKKKSKTNTGNSQTTAEDKERYQGRLKLDDALKQDDMKGWSEARIRAYQARAKNPNSYYYRFNNPGEAQKNGPWNKEERELFFKRLEEMKMVGSTSPQWGLFSMTIPGRVGYQCANYYRQLVRTGEIKDPNYVIDEKTKELTFLSGRGKAKKKKNPELVQKLVALSTKRGRKKKSEEDEEEEEEDETENTSDTDEQEDDSMEYQPSKKKKKKSSPVATPFAMIATSSSSSNSTTNNNSNSNATTPTTPSVNIITSKYSENPLPDFIDSITMEEIQMPAISPYGHVLGYRTWLKVLGQEPKNICPFTKQPLQKRDLIRLTFDNIEQHRSFIKNM